ncbi:hypothetical protein MLD38_000615 [Melastoma candidum]|uniref:Uncharacterized protein n=1 Tax=Melastoma candidum TaxID=119954 RepID=A0ACB9SAG0_9MYRT|nr:hypothetical protein MLD38_000615 [Melastoma candidum]
MEVEEMDGCGFSPCKRLQLNQRNHTKGLTLDPPRNHHHIFHFSLPLDPSIPSPKHVDLDENVPRRGGAAAEPRGGPPDHHLQTLNAHPLYLLAHQDSSPHQQQQDLFFYGRLDSQPDPQTRLPPPSKKRSLISHSAPRYGRKAGTAGTSSRLGGRGGGGAGGEIIEVQGGHIVRSTGRKDRHSKVCTAKGPRDRRVRLSADTAIQFYDVQDRLGYDRPSKAVDWLIKKAKAAIDELAQLPAWKPMATTVASSAPTATNAAATADQETMIDFRQTATALDPDEGSGLGSRQHRQMDEIEKQRNDDTPNSSFLPSSLDSDTIADTIKSFFPMGVSADHSSSSSMQFHGYSADLISRTSSQSQDLRLSLQSFQEQPVLLRPHHSQAHEQGHHQQYHQVVFAGTPHHHHHHHNQLGFDGSPSSSSAASTWLSDHQRIMQWNSSGGDIGISTAAPSGSGGLMFGSSTVASMPTIFGQHGHSFQQRGPLQSSNMASVHAWIDPTTAIATYDHQVMPGIGFAMGSYAGYSDITARIRGQEEEMHDDLNLSSLSCPASEEDLGAV